MSVVVVVVVVASVVVVGFFVCVNSGDCDMLMDINPHELEIKDPEDFVVDPGEESAADRPLGAKFANRTQLCLRGWLVLGVVWRPILGKLFGAKLLQQKLLQS